MTSRARVLIVDHDVSFRIVLKEALEAQGFAVHMQDRGEPVIAAVERVAFDAIVLDRELPDIGGLELLYFLRHRCPTIPIVITTASGGDLSEAVTLGGGAAAYLEKPVSAADVAMTLRALLKRGCPPRVRRAVSPLGQIGAELDSGGEGNLWAVVPAGGHGSHLRSLTWRVRRERCVPGEPSLLRQALECALLRVPPQRIVVPAMRRHRRYIQAEVGMPATRIVFQPRDRGTAADVLISAYWIRWRDPAATVVVVPPDRPAFDPLWLMDHVTAALEFVQQYPRWMTILGTESEQSSHGCIVPGPVLSCTARGPLWRVDRYVTAPWLESARRCRAAGGLAGTGIIVARAATLVDAARQLLPALHSQFVLLAPLLGTRLETTALRRAYAIIPSVNFSRAILEASTSVLAMMRVAGLPQAPGAQELELLATPE